MLMVLDSDAGRRQYAERFQDRSVVDRYHYRPDYPSEVFAFLNQLIIDEPRTLLDIGCGPGNITRHMLDYVERVEAVDISPQMLELARTLPAGDSPKIHWLLGKAEDVPLDPPYALVTAGRSLHWMLWSVVMPRFQQLLTPRGVLAIIGAREVDSPWQAALREITRRYSARPYAWSRDMLEQLEAAHLFQRQGAHTTSPMLQQQSLADYIAGLHSRSGFSLDIMPAEKAEQFDLEVHDALSSFVSGGLLTLHVVGHIVWGRPLSGETGDEQRHP